MTELTGFQFVTTLVVDFDKSENNDATKYTTFSLTQRQKQLLTKPTLVMLFQSIYTAIISNIQKFLEKFCSGLLFQ